MCTNCTGVKGRKGLKENLEDGFLLIIINLLTILVQGVIYWCFEFGRW